MTTYRDLVQRTVACRHADLELGLSRAREQEPFVIHVSNLLDKAGFKRAVWQTISAYYCVCNDGDGLEISSNRPDGYSVRIVFGDVPV